MSTPSPLAGEEATTVVDRIEDGAAGGRSSASVRRAPVALMAAVVATVVVVDQVTKSLAIDRLSDGDIDLFWTLRLNLTFNSGLAFSQGEGLTGYITIAGVILVAGLVWWSRGVTNRLLAVGVSLLIGGACGNLSDRLFRGHGGAVIDFIDLQWWPVFNVADIAVSCGAVLLIVSTLREPVDGEG